MSTLAERLSKVQVKVETPLTDISHYDLPQLEAMKIKFGNTHVGKTFAHMWNHEQQWVTWFVKHYPNSEKEDHRLVLRFVELKVEEAERWNHRVPVTASLKDQSNTEVNKTKGYAKAKIKAKSQIQKPTRADMDAATREELEQWEAMEALGIEEEEWGLEEILVREGEPTKQECLEADVQSLQTRLLHMENMLQQVVSHIQASASEDASKLK